MLEAAIDDPALVGGLTLYFRSGSGWYASGKPIGKKGWRTLRFGKASFTVEGTPAGWEKIDGIRLSAWRPLGKDVGNTSVRFRRLAAVWHNVALVVPIQAQSRTEAELAVAKEASHRIEVMLKGIGLRANPLDEKAIAQGDLGRRRVVVLPSNFTPSDRCIVALAKFVKSGGKLVIYAAANVPARLRAALQLADDPNSPVQENDRGAIFDYDVPADTREARNQLAATLGRLVPLLWKEMAQAELDRAGKVGQYETVGEVLDGVNPCRTTVVRHLDRARRDWESANELFAQEAYDRAIESAQAAHDSLVKAYLAAVESPQREGRAVWNHSGTGAFPDDPDSWNRSAKLLAENGFNMVFPNMLWGGLTHYPSDVLPRSVTFRRFGDQIEQCCTAAKRRGIEVHVWKVCFNLTTAPKDFVDKLRRKGARR